jgi:hypothetical protein
MDAGGYIQLLAQHPGVYIYIRSLRVNAGTSYVG